MEWIFRRMGCIALILVPQVFLEIKGTTLMITHDGKNFKKELI